MNINFSVVRPYCKSLNQNQYNEAKKESWWWEDKQLESGIRYRYYSKNSQAIIVITEFSKNPKTSIEAMFRRIIRGLTDLINPSNPIKKVVFQKGGLPIPSFFIDFLRENGICIELIFDDGEGGIGSELHC